jgi:hypothetical protein
MGSGPEARAGRRFNANLSPQADEDLGFIARQTGSSDTHVLGISAAIGRWVLEEMQAGRAVFSHAEGQRDKLLVPADFYLFERLRTRATDETSQPPDSTGTNLGISPKPDEDLWRYANEHDLIPTMLERGILTDRDVAALSRYFDRPNKVITRSLNKLSVGVARLG